MMERDVYVIGVGMHRFGKHDASRRDMAFTAGINALDDAGISFRDVGTLYNGYIGGQMSEGVGYAKDLGLTGLPVIHVENASATGSTAFREAVLSVAGGVTDVAMALGFDGQLRGMGGMRGGALNRPTSMESTLLPAAFFAFWAVRRMHENGTTVETYARIAAKNWNHARFNKYAERQAEDVITPERVLASPMVAYPHTAMMACGAGRRCRRRDRRYPRSRHAAREWAAIRAASPPRRCSPSTTSPATSSLALSSALPNRRASPRTSPTRRLDSARRTFRLSTCTTPSRSKS